MLTEPPHGVKTILRQSGRVVLIDERDRVLLFLWDDERLDVRRLWITPGGGLHPGESFEQAARRELWEETGIEGEPGPCVWERHNLFRFGEHWIEARERYFVLRVPVADVRDDGWSAHERRAFLDHRLWTAEEIVASSELFVPRRLGELLPPLLRGEYPPAPVAVGK